MPRQSRPFTLVFLLAVCATGNLNAQCPDGTPPPCAVRPYHAPAPAGNSVAVLYFDNLSRDTSDAFLADGLTEELITRLSQVHRIEVKSRFESLRFRGQRLTDPRAIGHAVGASYLVTGSLQQAGQRVRVNVALVRAQSGTEIWGDVYERSGDLLAVQGDIAREVAGAITGQLLPEERATLARMPTRDPVAYDLYLRGVGAANTISEAGMRAGLDYFDRAIARDAGFAEAYVQKAVVWTMLSDGYVEGRVGYARAREAAEQALRLDSSLAVAYAIVSQAVAALDADAGRAVALADRALALDPRSWWGHAALFAGLLIAGNQNDSAVAEVRRGWEADTLSAASAVLYLWILSLTRPDSVAAVLPRMRNVLGPEDVRAFDGVARLARGDAAGASDRLSWSYYGGLIAANYVQAQLALGRTAAARAAVDSMVGFSRHGYFNAFGAARAYAVLGNADSAFAWLDHAWEQRTIWIGALRVCADFARLHTDPRWAAFLRKMGLAP